MLNIGDKAPNFNLPDENGKVVSSSDYEGKWLVVYFYPKDDTPGCTKEACDFTDNRNEFAGLNAEVVGISRDDADAHQKFIAKYDLNVTLLSDPDHAVHEAYGAWGTKVNYGKEIVGVIRSTFIVSPDGEIAALWRKVSVRVKRKSGEVKHADKVKEKLTELQA
ncbi:MAG: thioredoxin-dependent thiol peroxidase [Anaerolineae bacterium]|jgi:thioredoxin-dependent peroxiredoxin|nr:thioredoxin-dependent thiol peroxidase [Anaerolineae bacterium]MBT7188759.1 thioredoxin-dependent thiol peroxidase [Anaerolineae bacterium]MBT7988740.1 thioredoxin-dependent thiol peroxidase [Anaerolineae bacterium]